MHIFSVATLNPQPLQRMSSYHKRNNCNENIEQRKKERQNSGQKKATKTSSTEIPQRAVVETKCVCYPTVLYRAYCLLLGPLVGKQL